MKVAAFALIAAVGMAAVGYLWVPQQPTAIEQSVIEFFGD